MLHCLFSLVKDIFLVCTTSGSKRAPEGKKLSHKHAAIDLEMKIRMVCNFEGGKSLSAIALTCFCNINCEHHHEGCSLCKRTCERNSNEEVDDNSKETLKVH
jgi:hypothetical protein